MKTPEQEAVCISLERAVAKGPAPAGNLAIPIFSHGSLDVELYTPKLRDPQTPHTRDEVYVVAHGEGLFFDGAQHHQVQRGSLMFVPAGQEHRFEEFSCDFAVWVLFYGPEGGESTLGERP